MITTFVILGIVVVLCGLCLIGLWFRCPEIGSEPLKIGLIAVTFGALALWYFPGPFARHEAAKQAAKEQP